VQGIWHDLRAILAWANNRKTTMVNMGTLVPCELQNLVQSGHFVIQPA
jgi:hypothetical protein